jgi:hypothetical protein
MPSQIQCYRCRNTVTPVVKEVFETSGYIGVDVPNTDATVFRPVGNKKYIGACPYCGAQMGNPQADRLNQEQQSKDEASGLLALIALGFIAVLVLAAFIMAATGMGDTPL